MIELGSSITSCHGVKDGQADSTGKRIDDRLRSKGWGLYMLTRSEGILKQYVLMHTMQIVMHTISASWERTERYWTKTRRHSQVLQDLWTVIGTETGSCPLLQRNLPSLSGCLYKSNPTSRLHLWFPTEINLPNQAPGINRQIALAPDTL